MCYDVAVYLLLLFVIVFVTFIDLTIFFVCIVKFSGVGDRAIAPLSFFRPQISNQFFPVLLTYINQRNFIDTLMLLV